MPKSAYRLFALVACLIVMHSATFADTIVIKMSDLGAYASFKSLASAGLRNSRTTVHADRLESLQSSNPEFSIEHQDIDGGRETEFSLSKTFRAPWVSGSLRSAWRDRSRAAELSLAEQQALLHAELKTGYITLQLLDAHLLRMNRFLEALTDASHVASTRHTEGHISGVEDHLIQMVVISLQSAHLSAQRERREVENQWRTLMGLVPEQVATLSTNIDFRQVQPTSSASFLQGLSERPGMQARMLLQESWRRESNAVRSGIIPSFTLSGGYKDIENVGSGIVAGFSLPLPLLNQNGGATLRARTAQSASATEASRYKISQFGRIESLIASIEGSRGMLAQSHEHFSQGEESRNAMFYAYEEGWMSLNELLNGIQIENSGLKDYYQELIRYYSDVFELEAITGVTLVTFE